MGECRIHGKHKGKTCGYCGLGNRIKDLTVSEENQRLKQRIIELETALKRSNDIIEAHINKPSKLKGWATGIY